MVHDGIILMKYETPLWQKAFNAVTTLFKEDGNVKEHERSRGVTSMLPGLVAQIKEGTGLYDLIATIKSIIHRQSQHLCGYCYIYNYYYADEKRNTNAKEQVLGKVRNKIVLRK